MVRGVVWRAESSRPTKSSGAMGASGKPRPTIEVTSGSATTPRCPPTQAAKKCGIGPQLFPVPPAESPVDGAGPQRGRKDGPPDSHLEPLNPHGSPFFFGFQKPFFFQQGKRNGFCRPRKVRTVQNALSGISHSAPLLVLSPRDPLRWARAGTPFLHVVWRAEVVAPHDNDHPDGGANHAARLPLIRLASGQPPSPQGKAYSLSRLRLTQICFIKKLRGRCRPRSLSLCVCCQPALVRPLVKTYC